MRSFRRNNQQRIRKTAAEAAEYLLNESVDLSKLNGTEHGVLQDITCGLLVKYFNGRDIKLLSRDYVVAEAVDELLEREMNESLSLAMAVAQMAVGFDKFIKAHDSDYLDDDVF